MKQLLVLFAVCSVLLLGCLQPQAQATPAPTAPVAAEATVAPTAEATPTSTIEIVEADSVVVLYDSFKPANIRVKAGTKVTWENQDGRLHSVKSRESSPESFYSYNIAGRQTWSYTFNKAGTFEYYDDLTNKGEGTVYVE